ncbi:tyrosine-type recombinase/integrase [Nitratireductor mangrovi]|uniref:Tyrosine-type recombinase/integrase n=1 Tax=Nitratireductor mangrovi TaxID=2599600 RepID=A0A5B8KZ19_9HYPH|nr:tyrosine-type recombinase/integrase [Nitratireductor mangrovi]QDZ00796.1 tyrosine-type recombinase/integrase [Nitratireductor mangrovi]
MPHAILVDERHDPRSSSLNYSADPCRARLSLFTGITQRDPKDQARRKGRATVPINDGLLEALRNAKEGALTDYVIEWAGKPVRSIRRGLKAAGNAIGRSDVSPHMLRHSAAVWLAEDGHSMDEIAQFLGHGDSKITARVYARFSPTPLRKLASSLEIRSGP